MSAADVLGGPHGLDAAQRDEVPLGLVVALVSFVDCLAADLDAQAVAGTEDVGTAEQPWRRRWKAVGAVGGVELTGWGAHRADAVEALRVRLAPLQAVAAEGLG